MHSNKNNNKTLAHFSYSHPNVRSIYVCTLARQQITNNAPTHTLTTHRTRRSPSRIAFLHSCTCNTDSP